MENGERICTGCGDVQEEFTTTGGHPGNLCMLPDDEAIVDNFRNKNCEANERLTARIRNETNSNDTKRQIGREKLLVEMRRIVKQLIKHPIAVDETVDLIGSIFKAHQGRLLSSKKYGLVGACIYFISAKHQIGISLADICKVLGIKLKVISVCLKQVRDLCPDFEYERPNIKDLVKKFVDELATKHYDLASLEAAINPQDKSYPPMGEISKLTTQPLIDGKDKKVLQDRVILLINLFEAMHPYNQPSPQSMITAVIYHAWRSLDTFKLIAVNLKTSMNNIIRSSESTKVDSTNDSHEQQINRQAITVKHSISYEKFCQLCNLKYSSNGQKIVTKLQSSLLDLGKYLGDVNKINLPWFLKDIIENSPHLIQEHMRTEPVARGSKQP